MGGHSDPPLFVSVEVEPCEEGLGEYAAYYVAALVVELSGGAEQFHAAQQYVPSGAEGCLYVGHLPPDAFLFAAYFLHLGTEFFLGPVRITDVGHERRFFGVQLGQPFG